MSDKYIMYDPAEFDKIEIKPAENSDEITRLRAENERLRRLVERIVEHHEHDENEVSGWTQWEALVKDARAALEGVTEKSGAGNE